MVFTVANQEMAIFSPLDSGAMRRLNYEVRFRHADVTRQPCNGTGRTRVGVAENTDMEISSLLYPLQEPPPALTVVTEVVLTEVAGLSGRFSLHLPVTRATEGGFLS